MLGQPPTDRCKTSRPSLHVKLHTIHLAGIKKKGSILFICTKLCFQQKEENYTDTIISTNSNNISLLCTKSHLQSISFFPFI